MFMKPKRILLVRHGESEGNVDKLHYVSIPDYALNLTKKGKAQAFEAGETIKTLIGSQSIYSYVSPFYRTRQTLEQIASVLGDKIVKTVEDPRIREQEWGHLRHPDETDPIRKERDEYSTFYFRIKDGESGADVYDRTSTFLETMYRDFNKADYPENALIVTHGLTLRIFLMRWLHWTVEEYENIKNPKNCEVIILEQNDKGKYELVTPLRTKKASKE